MQIVLTLSFRILAGLTKNPHWHDLTLQVNCEQTQTWIKLHLSHGYGIWLSPCYVKDRNESEKIHDSGWIFESRRFHRPPFISNDFVEVKKNTDWKKSRLEKKLAGP